ncbi:MAG: hypothetical protein HY976_03490 [Candidatus Kerfeldbacteria bacterium]|nr:hypothetical protein [Candidatus Kerfeldbacteria bacterium]
MTILALSVFFVQIDFFDDHRGWSLLVLLPALSPGILWLTRTLRKKSQLPLTDPLYGRRLWLIMAGVAITSMIAFFMIGFQQKQAGASLADLYTAPITSLAFAGIAAFIQFLLYARVDSLAALMRRFFLFVVVVVALFGLWLVLV